MNVKLTWCRPGGTGAVMANPVPTGITSPPTRLVETSRSVAAAGRENRRKLNWPIMGGAERSGTSVVSLRFSSVNSCTAAMRRVAESIPATMIDCSVVVTTPTSRVNSYTVRATGSAKSDCESTSV